MTTVVLVDDHELIRHGLAGAFTRDEAFTVVGQAGTVAEGVDLAEAVGAGVGGIGLRLAAPAAEGVAPPEAVRPDVLVIDLQLPDGSGLDLVRTVRKDRKDIG